MHRHPNDPPAQHDAAEKLGRMKADGLLPEGEASKTMAAIVRDAFKHAPDAHRHGLRMRLVWSARDAQAARHHERDNVRTAVRWAARPLIQAKASREATLDAARKAAGDVLTDAEIMPILADEWERAHRSRGRK